MTYLSRIRINPLRAESRRLLANPRVMHAAVMGGIPPTSTSERPLWRLDADDPHCPHLFVLTRTRPDWTHVVERAGWPDAEGDHASVRDYTPLLAQITTGRDFAFRLTANPVQNIKAPDKANPDPTPQPAEERVDKRSRGIRTAHRTAAHQLNWFLTRTTRWGFDVPHSHTDPPAPGLQHPGDQGQPPTSDVPPAREVRITDRRRHSFTKRQHSPPVTFYAATFEGRLRITHAETFTTHLLNGIGPSKAYGCGLLTVAPLPRSQG